MTYVIMGANGGIGESLALRLGKAGQKVIATMRNPEGRSQPLKDLQVATHQVDVTIAEDIEAALSGYESVSGFAYCIGSIDLMPLKAAKDDVFLRSYEINVLGAIRSLRVLEKALKAGKGSVVMFSSIAVQQGYSNHAVISSAKGAIEALTKALAAEWAGQVRVNCIAPSLTQTAIAKPLVSSPQIQEAIAKMHPIPRLGMPEDCAAAAEFLLGPASDWITGQVLHVDGGRSTLKPKG